MSSNKPRGAPGGRPRGGANAEVTPSSSRTQRGDPKAPAVVGDSAIGLFGAGGAESDASSSSPQGDIVAELRQQLQAMQLQMQRQQQALLSAQQSASALPATSPLQQQPPLAPSPIPLAAPVRMAAVQPGELTYRTAGEPSVLADWLFKVEQLLSQLGVSADAWEERLRVVSLHWDRQLDLWWQGHCQQARAAGTPVASWAAFRAALQANFVPTNDAEAAASELLRLRMRSGETMDAYMQRAALLLARSDGRLPGEAAARAALDGVDASRFPFTLSSARRLMRQAPAGSPLTFHAMRAELTASAVDEPQLGARGAASAAVHMSARPQGGSGSGAARMTKQHLVAACPQVRRGAGGSNGGDGGNGPEGATRSKNE